MSDREMVLGGAPGALSTFHSLRFPDALHWVLEVHDLATRPHSISESEVIIDAFTVAVRDALRDAIVDSHYVSSGGIVDDTVRERIMLAYATRLANVTT